MSSGLNTLGRVDESLPLIRDILACFPENRAVRLQAAVTELRALERPLKVLSRDERRQRARQLDDVFQSLLAEPTSADQDPEEHRQHTLYPLRYLGDLALLQGQVSEGRGIF